MLGRNRARTPTPTTPTDPTTTPVPPWVWRVDAVEVNQLLKQFRDMGGVMQKMAGMSNFERMRAMAQMGPEMMQSGGSLQVAKQRSKRGPADLKAAEEKKKRQKKDAAKQRKKNRK